MKHFTQIVLLVFSCILVACSVSPFSKRSAASCPKKKSRKVKTYRVKKNKKSSRSYAYSGSGGGRTSSKSTSQKTVEKPKPAPPVKKEEPKEAVVQAPKPNPKKESAPKVVEPREEPPVPSIADAKDTAREPQNEIRLKGKKVDLDKKEFKFDENIEFKDRTDSVVNKAKVQSQMRELIKLLKENKNIKVTIIGNAASTVPIGGVVYGDSEDALNQVAVLGKDTVQIRDVMTARAKVIYNLLKNKGVSSSQMEYETGSYRKWEKQRVVSFILRRKED